MCQYANLRRNFKFVLYLLEEFENLLAGTYRIIYRIKPQHRVPGSVAQTLVQRRSYAVDSVHRVVRLKSRGQAAPKPNGCVAGCRHSDLSCAVYQVQIRHQLGNRRNHFRSQPSRKLLYIFLCGLFGQNVLSQLGDGPILYFAVNLVAAIVLNDSRNFVFFIRNRRIVSHI